MICHFSPSHSNSKPSPIGPLLPNMLKVHRNALSQKGSKKRIDYREANVMYHRDIFSEFLQWVKKHNTQVSNFFKFAYVPDICGVLDVEKLKSVQEPWHDFLREIDEQQSFVDAFRDMSTTRYPEMQSMGYVSC